MLIDDAVSNSRIIQGRAPGMSGRREHDGSGPQRLPGRPAEQARRHPRAGRQDGQQAGAVPDEDAVGAGPGDPATDDGAETTWYGAWL